MSYERHVRRGATVDSIEAAFAFCLTGIEEEGIELPVIEVTPILEYDEADGGGVARFQVSVAGSVPVRDEGPGDDD